MATKYLGTTSLQQFTDATSTWEQRELLGIISERKYFRCFVYSQYLGLPNCEVQQYWAVFRDSALDTAMLAVFRGPIQLTTHVLGSILRFETLDARST